MAGLADPNAAIELSLSRANRLILAGRSNTLELLRQADKELSERLQHVAKHHGGASSRYTEAHAQIYRQQIALVTDYVQQRMRGQTDKQALEAIRLGVQQTVDLATRLEERFTGITQPLMLHSQQMQDELVRGSAASRMRQNEASWNRYGEAMTRSFERQLRLGQLMGLPQSEVISRLVSEGKQGGIDAAVLRAQTPGSFPDPTGYVAERYWAERIARTETAHSLNSASLNTMQEFKNTDFPDMQKKILAHFDNRTAPDSVAVHGQIRPLDGYFMDGCGRRYLHPPGRPNDRETVIPWRPHWAELEATEPPKPAEIASAQQAATGSQLSDQHHANNIESIALTRGAEAQARRERAKSAARENARKAEEARRNEAEGYLNAHRVAGTMDWLSLARSLNSDESRVARRAWEAIQSPLSKQGAIRQGKHANSVQVEGRLKLARSKAALKALRLDELAVLRKKPLKLLRIADRVYVGGEQVMGFHAFSLNGSEIHIGTRTSNSSQPGPLNPGRTGVVSGANHLDDISVTVRHEYGHHLHRSAPWWLDDKIAQAFSAGKPITQYASVSRSEYFAESYAAYRREPETLRRYDPHGWAIVREVMDYYGLK